MRKLIVILIFVLLLSAALFASAVGTCSAASTSCTLSSVATGNFIICFAYHAASNVVPSLPSGNNNIMSGALSVSPYAAIRVYGRYASSSSDTSSGVATNATDIACESYSSVQGIGVTNTASDSASTTITTPALSLNYTDSTSWVVGFAGASAAAPATPSGMTSRTTVGSGPGVRLYDTNAAVSSFSALTTSVTSSTWISAVVELMANLPAPTVDVGAGTYYNSVTVNLLGQSGVTICYTTDLSTPTATTTGTCTNGSTFSSPLTFTTTTTLKALATQSGKTNSSVASFTYTVTAPPPYLKAWNGLTITGWNGFTLGSSTGNLTAIDGISTYDTTNNVAPVFVQGIGSGGQTSNNPMVYTVTTTAGNGFTLQWQTSNSSGNVAATSIATSNGDVCVIDSNSGTNAMGMGHCTNLVGGSTTFRIYFASTPSSWAMLTGAEISHFGGVDCIGGPLDTANTGTAGTTFYSAYCTTNHKNTIMFATASDEGEIGLSNGNVGCCVTGTQLSSGDPGAQSSYQLFTTQGTYRAGFASSIANDTGTTNMVIYYGK